MSAWQSFIVAWVAAQLIPVVLEEPSFPVLLGAAELIAAFIAFFTGLNLAHVWLHQVLARGSAAGALGSGFRSSPTVTNR